MGRLLSSLSQSQSRGRFKLILGYDVQSTMIYHVLHSHLFWFTRIGLDGKFDLHGGIGAGTGKGLT